MTSAAPDRPPVVAVLPAYHPDETIDGLVAAVSAQVSGVVVVADGAGAVPAAVLDRCEVAGATVARYADNRGIGAALNAGIATALDGGAAAAVLTIDQDSMVPDGYVDALLAAWERATAAGLRVGLVAPERVTGLPSQVTGRLRGVALGRDPVQSGVLLPVATVRTVGRFDEGLFIDGVDADYALRCLDAGLSVVVAEGLALGHRLGGTHDVRVAGRTLTLTRSAPFRYYYLARNRARLVRRHARRHPRWAAGQALGLARHLAVTSALVPGRRARACETLAGLRDAARGVSGRRPPSQG